MIIQEKFIGYGLNNNPNTTLAQGKPLGIIAHQTGNTNISATAKAHSNMQHNDSLEVSWNATADDIEVIQDFADNRKLWHAGDTWANNNLMSLEICVNKRNDREAYLKALRNGAFFIATKMKKYGWGLDKVYRHKEFANTTCPAEISANYHGVDWAGFKKMISEELAKLNNKPATPTPTTSNPEETPSEKTMSKVAKKHIGMDGSESKIYATGKNVNDDWCVYFVDMILNKVYGIEVKVGFVDELKALLTPVSGPIKDGIAVYDRNNNGIGDHIGIISYAHNNDFVVIEGNTKNDDNMKSVVSENSYNVDDLPFTFYTIPDSLKKLPHVIEGKPMKVILVEDTHVFKSVEDAANNVNPIVYKAGEYSIYKTFAEYVNITKTSTPGGWVKLRGIK